MFTFGNELAGGVTLVRAALQSPNYVAGASGWSVKIDGSAEFNNVTIRGGLVEGAAGLWYNGTPAFGNLVASVNNNSAQVQDQFGNWVLGGVADYVPAAFAAVTLQEGVVSYTTSNLANQWVQASSILMNSNGMQLTSLGTETITVNSQNPFILTTATNTTKLSVSAGGRLEEISPGSSIAWTADVSQTDTSTIASGNAFSAPVAITKAYPTDTTNGATAGAVYRLTAPFNGTWGLQVMTVYADINGTNTAVGTVGAAFATGAASGDAINGHLELIVTVVSATACRLHLAGVIHDNTVNPNNSDTAGSIISGTVVTGVTFAAGDTIALAVQFAATVAAQTIQTQGSDFTRKG